MPLKRQRFAATSSTKSIILVLNKVEIVQKIVTNTWLAYLFNDYPTVAVRAFVLEERRNRQAKLSSSAALSTNISKRFGASSLMTSLKNNARSRNIKESIPLSL